MRFRDPGLGQYQWKQRSFESVFFKKEQATQETERQQGRWGKKEMEKNQGEEMGDAQPLAMERGLY